MSTPSDRASARTLAQLAVAELATTNRLLEATTAAIASGLHAQTIGADDVYLMLRAVADRQALDMNRVAALLEVQA